MCAYELVILNDFYFYEASIFCLHKNETHICFGNTFWTKNVYFNLDNITFHINLGTLKSTYRVYFNNIGNIS